MSSEKKIKVCIDPHCEEVALNCDVKTTRCRNCGMKLVAISRKTYEKKFRLHFFQYDYNTDKLVHPEPQPSNPRQLTLNLKP